MSAPARSPARKQSTARKRKESVVAAPIFDDAAQDGAVPTLAVEEIEDRLEQVELTSEAMDDGSSAALAVPGGVSPSDPLLCEVEGLLPVYFMRQSHGVQFTIVAQSSSGERQSSGGETFVVAIRGASKGRARVSDVGDGTYQIYWKPECSGTYQVAISLRVSEI